MQRYVYTYKTEEFGLVQKWECLATNAPEAHHRFKEHFGVPVHELAIDYCVTPAETRWWTFRFMPHPISISPPGEVMPVLQSGMAYVEIQISHYTLKEAEPLAQRWWEENRHKYE